MHSSDETKTNARSRVPIVALRSGAIFPGTRVSLPIGRAKSVALASTLSPGDMIACISQRDATVSDPTDSDLYNYGTLARVVHVARNGEHEYRVAIEAFGRFNLQSITQSEPYLLADGQIVEDAISDSARATSLARKLRESLNELAPTGGSLAQLSGANSPPGQFADQVASALGLDTPRENELLAEPDVIHRLELVTEWFDEAKNRADVKRTIDNDVRREIGKSQREMLLREQLRAIQRELGDDRGESDIASLKKRLDEANLPEDARTVADRELKRLESMNGQGPEVHVIRNYLEWIADLPWSQRADAHTDIDAVSNKLDEDHYGLSDVKKRILEQLAVLKLSGNPAGNILCLVGPPGVGKTSIGQSIADATHRPMVRISLGGVRDEAEIRGHRRTYVGSLPGRVLHALKKAKVKNPLILLDEVDKLGVGWQGSPEAALLEVLDPEQNKSFTDHYLELPFDLSEVLFVCTANTLETLSAPLRDRLEIIELNGYTADEKANIATRHLLPKKLSTHALPENLVTLTDAALRRIINEYTREAGVRQLAQQITKICRGLALKATRQMDQKVTEVRIDEADITEYLGKPKFFSEVAERTSYPGVATGLAWTPVGGDILFIETSRMPGKGHLEITGQLGDVMKESARAALTYVRSNAGELGVDPQFLESQDIHVHVPAGGVPKDGPSAGVTIFTALTSLLSGRCVRSDTAMTGEVTLRGRVLPVGGIKAKVLAAHRAGITRVILPSKNARDLDEVPAEARRSMEFFFADDMSQVIEVALEKEASLRDPRRRQEVVLDTPA